MLAGDDAALMQPRGVEVADVRGRAVIQRQFQHLIEVAIVERTVPADR